MRKYKRIIEIVRKIARKEKLLDDLSIFLVAYCRKLKVMSCSQIRDAENIIIENTNIKLFDLMLRAGTGLYKFIKNMKNGLRTACIICGSGNNGGDGFVAAKMLSHDGVKVSIILVGEAKTNEARRAFDMLRLTNIPIYKYIEDFELYKEALVNADVIVDAVYGIGFKGTLNEDLIKLFKIVSKLKATKISVDLPSGIECDIGLNTYCESKDIQAFSPDYTYTFIALKPAHVFYPSSDYCGEVILDNLSINDSIMDACDYVMETTRSIKLPKRKLSSNKGDFGTLVCICGSYMMAGAAIMAAKAALRCGVGLIDLAVPESIYPIISSNLCEPVFTVYNDNKKLEMPSNFINQIAKKISKSKACLIGCGMHYSQDFDRFLGCIIKASNNPLIIDAGGINVLSFGINILKEANCPIILTPHPGEMSKLINKDILYVQQHRYEIALKFAKEYKVILVLKGSNTLIAFPNGEVFVNRTGNPGMSKGGSGDILAGMISSMIASGVNIKEAILSSVYLHGRAGDMCKEKFSEIAMTPTDIIDMIPEAIKEMESL